MATSDGTTGRYLVLYEESATAAAGVQEINDVTGIQTVSLDPSDESSVVAERLSQADGISFDKLRVACVDADSAQLSRLRDAAAGPGPIAMVEPERIVHAIPAAPATEASTLDESVYTWGLQAIGAPGSDATGKGIRVAVLDTGFDVKHPDFAGRTVTTASFVKDEDVQDGHGHGTHCIGTSCGPRKVDGGPGYGVAYEAEIFAGKVLSNKGSGTDRGILAGIEWAINNDCAVISMSLGAATAPDTPFSPLFEEVAVRAMAAGTLIIAAAGNESDRRVGRINPVGHPANCPSIMAVGATDPKTEIAYFSCGTVGDIGAVDIVAPGWDVHSSVPMPKRYAKMKGTSMATPHVAGVAAQIAQKYGSRAWELWARLAQGSRRLPLPSTDVGSGLVQAP
ncbi:subtilase family protein [Herbihabitans rhizosphaerae]|uniref:Subtilase family protein n=1 Tax=Herbihabitans rhizosphaerae TaxID=1872711 RepID=A0A4Q7L5C7_9PSEU|nr:S8 family serine peptidase [Herbihabitans rhizosphaerae]RZS43442.1 subtilase family protein [Herbihabitans rhizosphaerae]